MLFVIAQPFPKSTNFDAAGATPSDADNGETPQVSAMSRGVCLKIRDMRGTEGAENKGYRPTLRQHSKSFGGPHLALISAGEFFR